MHDDIESIKIISNLTPSITSFLEMFEFRLYHNFLTLLPPFYHIFTTPLPFLWANYFIKLRARMVKDVLPSR